MQVTVEEELKRGEVGLMNVDDLLQKARNASWNEWHGNIKEYWTSKKLLDSTGEMRQDTRAAILLMDLPL